ncbi:MAG: hypothetical protein LBU61_06775 [Coriobacteriales bacterium]|jgi:hypothetical protein|nr:hypothetical protein [Coriobacteriales bacterium]
MQDRSSEETKSYRDPLGEAGFTSLLELPEKPEKPEPETEQNTGPAIQYPAVDDCYLGFYQRFSPDGKAGWQFLAGVEGIIGTQVRTRAVSDKRELLGIDNRVIGFAEGAEISHLNALEQAGWLVECRLSLSVYHPDQKSYSGEVAWIAYNSAIDKKWQAFQAFIDNLTFRIAFGTHPGLALDQQQFEQVLRSKGQWCLTKDVPIDPLPSGALIHKRSRSLADRLVHTAIQHRLGCNIAAWVFIALLLIAAGIALYVVFT